MATLKPSTSIYKTIVRTVTPWVVGAVVWSAQRFGWHVNAGTASEVAGLVGIGISILVPPLERKWPWLGAFLGWVGAPTYDANVTKADLEAQLIALQTQLASSTTVAPGTPVALTLTPND